MGVESFVEGEKLPKGLVDPYKRRDTQYAASLLKEKKRNNRYSQGVRDQQDRAGWPSDSSKNHPPSFGSVTLFTASKAAVADPTRSISASDLDGDELKFKTGTRPTGIKFTDNKNGTCTFTVVRSAVAIGTYNITVKVSDGFKEVSTVQAITVTA